MKQKNRKSPEWLWPGIISAVLLVAAGIVLGLVFGFGGRGGQGADDTPDGKLYWNVDGQKFQIPGDSRFSAREAGEDGLYHIRFSADGGQMEFTAADKKLVNVIDAAQVMGLELDGSGNIIDVIPVDRIASKIAASFFVQDINGSTLTLNSSAALNGMKLIVTLDDTAGVYDVTSEAETVGAKADCELLDKVMVYGDRNGNPTHVYIVEHTPEADVYWRIARMYDSKTKGTSRVPDENGGYTVLAAKDGVQVEVKFRAEQKDLVDLIDRSGRYDGTFAPIFDEEGYVVDLMAVAKALRGKSAAASYHITSLDENGFACEYLMADKAQSRTWTGKYHPKCRIYNVSDGSTADVIGEPTKLLMGDRVVVFTNTRDEAILIYVVNRLVDSPVYWNYTRKYSTKTRETTREPDENGYYVFRVAANGKEMTVRTKSKALASQMDSYSPQWFALELSGDVVEKVFPAKMATGGNVKASYFVVESISGEEIVTCSQTGSSTAVLKPADDMRAYNVSPVFDDHWGEQTKLKVGDQIHALTDRSGRIVVIFIRSRKVDSPLYWNAARKYNTTTKETTRRPDGEGYYVYDLAVNGEVKKFRTDDKELANLVDSYRVAFALKVEGDIIKQVYSSTAAKGIKGATASWLDVMSIKDNKVYVQQNSGTASDYGKGYEITLARNYKVYDVCGYVNAFGSAVSLDVGDRIYALTNDDGEVAVVYVVCDNTRAAGAIGHCDHCNKDVFWAPWSGEDFYAPDGHYHLTHDLTASGQCSVGKEKGGEVYDIVLDLNGKTLTTGSRGFLVWGSSAFSLMDSAGTGTVAAKGAAGNAGNILVTGGGKFNFYGGTLTLREDAVSIKRGGIIHLSGAESVVNMYGGTVIGGKANEGGNVYVEGGTFNITGGTVTKGISGSVGGNIHVAGSGVLNVSGGVITAGEAKCGGNISALGSGTVVISGGKLDQGNASLYGGNIFGYDSANITVSGAAEVAKGTAVTSGGNIYISGGSGDQSGKLPGLTVSGGRISGGKLASGTGSNIRSCRGGEITISGGNIAGDILLNADDDGSARKVVLSGTPVIGKGLNNGLSLGRRAADVSGLTTGANISISTAGTFTTRMENPDSYTSYFTPYDSEMRIVVENGALVCGVVAACAHCNGADAIWSGWTGEALPEAGGHYRLTKNTALSQQLVVGLEGGGQVFDVVIDLNGKTLAGEKRAFLVWHGSKLSIMDSKGSGTVEAKGFSDTANAGAILLQGGAEFNLYSGTLRSATEDILAGSGGIIYMSHAATTVNMYGGTIQGNSAAYGGAVFIENGTFNMFSGTVTGGSATKHGGNFFIKSGKLNVTGGLITGGQATEMGGNIAGLNDAVVAITGAAAITDGTATSGGNIYISQEKGDTSGKLPSLTVTGGTISGGRLVSGKGSNIQCCRGAVVTISGGKIAGDVVIGDDLDGFVHSLSITGKPIIGKGITGGLDLGGRKIDPTLLHPDARITISGTGVFTEVLTNPADYLGVFQTYSDDQKVGILSGALFCDRYTYCQHCKTKILWTPWEGGESIPEGHIYLPRNAVYTGNPEIKGTADNRKDIVIDLNGNKLTSNATINIRHLTLSVFDTKGNGIWGSKGVAGVGCVVCISSGSVLNLYGGTIAEHKGHTACAGGVVYMGAADAAFHMYGGRIMGGDDVGALLMDAGTCNITGGIIDGENPNVHNITVKGVSNVTIGGDTKVHGGILVENCDTFTLTGCPVIDKGREFGLKLPAEKKLTIENLAAGAKISITAPGAFVTGNDTAVLEAWKLKNFISDDLTKEIVVDGQQLTFAAVQSITRCAFGHTTHDGMTCPAEIVAWKPWTTNNALPCEGNYFLTADLSIPNNTAITGNVQIDLNSFKIINSQKLTGSTAWEKRRLLNIHAGASLCITDLSAKADGTVALNNSTTCGAGALAIVSGTMKLYGGTMDATGLRSETKEAAAILVKGEGASFTMYGGTVEGVAGAQGTCGSTIHVAKTGTANIHGGKLIGGVAMRGANVYTEGALNITGGTFVAGDLKVNSSGDSFGANIYVGVAAAGDDATATLSISGDANFNGGIWVEKCKSITLSGKPVIEKSDTEKIGLRLPACVRVDVNRLSADARIGITLAADGAFATATHGTVLDALRHSFITDVATKEVVVVDNHLVQQDIPCVSKCLVGHETHHGACSAGEILEWVPWREENTLPTQAGNYYLMNDVTLTAKTTFVNDVNLDLNGSDIIYTIPAGKTTRAFNVASDANVSITDLSGHATPGRIVVKHSDANGEVQAGAVMYVYGNVSLYNITVDASTLTSTQKGSAAFAVEGGTLNINSGKILGVNCRPNADYTKDPHGSTIVAWGGNVGIHGGELIGGSGVLSGNIYTTGNLTITGGKLVGGENQRDGIASNIFVNGTNSQVVISGDNINIDGGVFVNKAKSILVGGKAVIQTTMQSKAQYNLRLGAGIPIVDADKNILAISVDGDYTIVYDAGSVVRIAPVTEVVRLGGHG